MTVKDETISDPASLITYLGTEFPISPLTASAPRGRDAVLADRVCRMNDHLNQR